MELNRYIEHTLLRADATEKEIVSLCQEAICHRFATVCVNSGYVPMASRLLAGTGVETCCVVGFPLGAMATGPKAAEAAWAVEMGAQEVDMVLNIGAMKSGNTVLVREDIKAVVEVCHPGALVKVILETCLLTHQEKITACKLAAEAGADFVKTATGFSAGGATPQDVALLREVVGAGLGVKASGGIRSRAEAEQMIKAGADRIGTSSGVAMMAQP